MILKITNNLLNKLEDINPFQIHLNQQWCK